MGRTRREEYIRLMAQAASYEKNHYQQDSIAKRYYRQDYIGRKVLGACFWATIYYIIYWAYRLADIFYIKNANLLTYDYRGLVVHILVVYVVVLVVVGIIAGLVHARRYDAAKKRLNAYYDLLDQIDTFEL